MVMSDLAPILAEPVAELPVAGAYAFETKWDGFRCLLHRADDGTIRLQSRRGTSLTTAFSDIAEAAERDFPEEILLDGEVVIWHDGRLDFGRLQRRLNRKAATVRREIAQSPAHYVTGVRAGSSGLSAGVIDGSQQVEDLCSGCHTVV
ncbi:hypothetical protein DMH18_26090 [Streptomyces sp. WAC 06783]|uniref:ATP-dependent DNA ligase n=1 Tax=Streptomyces sp. WAC 06783 TaxID=2203211 RepID=UPI000F74660F|nr:hypothetical protein [Streptomyces sp. WAC 06783]RSO06927.1 hypothetical protein DMH18_26090 [Streptomyces sp. WAC 06783]